MSKFFRLRENEGYGACDDAVPPRAPKKKDIRKDVFLFCLQGVPQNPPQAKNGGHPFGCPPFHL